MTSKPPLPTDRSFGLKFAGVFAVQALENCILERREQDASLKRRYETCFDLD